MIKKIAVVLGFSFLIGCAFRTTPPAQIVNVTGSSGTGNGMTAADGSTATNASVEAKPVQTKVMALNSTTTNPVNNSPNVKPISEQNKQYVKNSASSLAKSKENSISAPSGAGWMLPVNGGAMSDYNSAKKGIDISGRVGQAIYAADSGKVVYSGNGLKGYGNLIIIKHNNDYLSAYAHNKVNLVEEGDSVKRGQKIAEMGLGDNGNGLLHFEIRKNGKPVNPNSVIGNN